MIRLTSILLLGAMPLAAAAEEPAVTAALTPFAPAPAMQDYDWTGPSVGLGFAYVPDVTGDAEGFVYGVRLGYDVDFGDYVVGGLFDYGTGDIDFESDVDVDSIWRLGVRGGIDAGRNWFYATAGYTAVETDGASSPGDSDGYFLGIGYEVFLTDTVTAGAELVHSTFDDFDNGEPDIDSTAVGLSVNYRF